MTADFRKARISNSNMEQILRDSGDEEDSNDGGFDQALL